MLFQFLTFLFEGRYKIRRKWRKKPTEKKTKIKSKDHLAEFQTKRFSEELTQKRNLMRSKIRFAKKSLSLNVFLQEISFDQ